MPIYEYVCKKCQHHFEAITQGSKTPECPSCHSKRLEKQLSVFVAASSSGHSQTRFSENAPVGACGTCGDPRGPGSCSLN